MTLPIISLTKIICWIVAGALFIAIARLPIGYYTILRFMVCGSSLYFVYVTYQQNEKINAYTLIFILTAIIFNPIHPVYFSKVIWRFLDAGTALWFIWYSLKKP